MLLRIVITTSPLRHRQRGNMTRSPVPKPPATTTYSPDSPARRHDRQDRGGLGRRSLRHPKGASSPRLPEDRCCEYKRRGEPPVAEPTERSRPLGSVWCERQYVVSAPARRDFQKCPKVSGDTVHVSTVQRTRVAVFRCAKKFISFSPEPATRW